MLIVYYLFFSLFYSRMHTSQLEKETEPALFTRRSGELQTAAVPAAQLQPRLPFTSVTTRQGGDVRGGKHCYQ